MARSLLKVRLRMIVNQIRSAKNWASASDRLSMSMKNEERYVQTNRFKNTLVSSLIAGVVAVTSAGAASAQNTNQTYRDWQRAQQEILNLTEQ